MNANNVITCSKASLVHIFMYCIKGFPEIAINHNFVHTLKHSPSVCVWIFACVCTTSVPTDVGESSGVFL